MESVLIARIGLLVRRFAIAWAPRLWPIAADQLWARADVAHMENDVKAAHEIYRLLSRRSPAAPYEFLFVGLAAYRLQDVARALDVLEEGQRRYPAVSSLVDNFLRIGVEQGQIDRIVRSIDPQAGRTACERLVAQSADWNTQINFLVYCVRAGLWDLATRRVDAIIRACDDTRALWKLSDILFALGRKNDADRIYEKLSGRVADSPEAALYAALALERLRAPERAAERLEAELVRYPDAPHLREHFFRICFGSGQVDRILRGTSGVEALEALFDRFSDPAQQLKLIEYCLDKGHAALVKAKVRRVDGGRYESGLLWNIAQRMDDKGFVSDARDVRRDLVDRSRKSSQDAYFAAVAALRLGDVDLCLGVLEDGQTAYPAANDLRNLYLQLCAGRLEYERYSTFMIGMGVDAQAVYSITDFYRAAVKLQASESFVLNYQDLQRICAPETFATLKNDVLAAIGKNPLTKQKARLLAFFTRYLDLDDEFALALWELLRGRASEAIEAGETLEGGQRALEILFRMTPPMIPAERGRSEVQIRQFVSACHDLARRPIEMVEPIADMSCNWTPWQYLFCSGALHQYGSAIAAFESLVFKTWPKLNYTAGHVSGGAPQRTLRRRIRIGFIVHDSMPMMSGLLSGLDPDVYETVFLRPGKVGQSRAAENWISRAERVVEFSDQNTYLAVDAIAAEQLDIIVSGPSVASVFFPMMARLAHLQIVLLEPNWTDGLSNADYYVSWQAAEPDNPREFYRSKVALLKHPPYFIERHRVGEISDEAKVEVRQRLLGLGESDRIYLCANTPPKIHPDMDEMFRKLLESDPEATLVILRGEYPPTKTLKTRLHQKLGKLADRVVFLPTLKQEDAHSLLLSVDACLDSFPLGGMSSSFDAAMLGVPTVTIPTAIPFGKWTASIYDYIGVSGLTAKDQNEYLQIALRLARDPVWRNMLGAELRQKANFFIESKESVSGFANFISQSWARHLAGLPPTDWIDDRWEAPAAKAGPRRQSIALLEGRKGAASRQ